MPIPPGGIVLDDLPWFDPLRGARVPRDVGDEALADKDGIRSGCYWRRPKHAKEEYDA